MGCSWGESPAFYVPLRGHNWKGPIPESLVVVCTDAITTSNEAMLRFCMIDEPDHLGLTFWLATELAFALWAGPSGDGPGIPHHLDLPDSRRGERDLVVSAPAFPLAARWRRGLRSLIPGALVGIGLYWLQRLAANLLIPENSSAAI
jgi:hypothetical protein